MTISITWSTGVIYVQKVDMKLIQSDPTVIYELDIDDFRLVLKGLEDDIAGMGFQKTHDHNTTVSVGGVTLARVINILEPYTITFEDGQYAVNLINANSNIGDRVNVNQVSIRSANSAGLITVVSGSGVLPQDILDIADQVWDEPMADHLTAGSTGAKLNEGITVDASEIADAVWDELLSGHVIDGSAGEYLTEFYNALARGEVYVASSTATEITYVRDKLGDAGVQVTETITDEEGISESTDVVFPAERMIYSVTSVYLLSDPTHAGTEYYGATGSFDQYTGAITLETSLPGDNTPVLINYTMMRGLPDTVIDWFLDEAKLYVENYTKESYTWSEGLGVDPVIRTRVALLAAISYAAMQCLESIATGDIVQLGYEFRFGDLEVNNQVTGGFHVQAHIDLLKSDIERKLAILGRKMTFIMRSTKALGRDAWGYKRSAGGRRQVY